MLSNSHLEQVNDQHERSSHHIPSINALPDELIAHIFLLGLPPIAEELECCMNSQSVAVHTREYLASIFLVCKLWHSIMKSTPRLWTVIYWSQQEVADLASSLEYQSNMRSFASRSRGLPIHLYLEIDDKITDNCEVLEHSSRAVALHVDKAYFINIHNLMTKGDWDSVRHLCLTECSGSTESSPIIWPCPLSELTSVRVSRSADAQGQPLKLSETEEEDIESYRISRSSAAVMEAYVEPASLREVAICALQLEFFTAFLRRCNNLRLLRLDHVIIPEHLDQTPMEIPSIRLDCDIRLLAAPLNMISRTITWMQISHSFSGSGYVTLSVLPCFPALETMIMNLHGQPSPNITANLGCLLRSAPVLKVLHVGSGLVEFPSIESELLLCLKLQEIEVFDHLYAYRPNVVDTIRRLLDLRPHLKVRLKRSRDKRWDENVPGHAVYEVLLEEYVGRFEMLRHKGDNHVMI